jgi:hypothetical protein
MSDQPPHVPMGEGYPPHEEGQHVVGPTCSSGCAQYGNRDEARTAQYARKRATYCAPPNASTVQSARQSARTGSAANLNCPF